MNIQVTVVYSPRAREVCEIVLQLTPSSSVSQAVEASGLLARFPAIEIQTTVVGIWGRKVSLDQTLAENDRIEIYRALTVDPKMARRERFNQQGARSAGLFARKRPNAKPGY